MCNIGFVQHPCSVQENAAGRILRDPWELLEHTLRITKRDPHTWLKFKNTMLGEENDKQYDTVYVK